MAISRKIRIDCPLGTGVKSFTFKEEYKKDDRFFYIFFCENESCGDGNMHCEFELASDRGRVISTGAKRSSAPHEDW